MMHIDKTHKRRCSLSETQTSLYSIQITNMIEDREILGKYGKIRKETKIKVISHACPRVIFLPALIIRA